MDVLHWTLIAMFMVAFLAAWGSRRRKLEYWRLWTKAIDQREELLRALATEDRKEVFFLCDGCHEVIAPEVLRFCGDCAMKTEPSDDS